MSQKPKKLGKASDGALATGKMGQFSTILSTPPLIDGEDEDEYQEFRASCLSAIRPKDALEEVWLQDFVDYSWEAWRLRRMKAPLIQAGRVKAVENLLVKNCGVYWTEAPPLSKAWSASDEAVVAEIETLFEAHNIDTDTIMAKAISSELNDLERIDKLIGFYDSRRDASIRELEKRRDQLAKRAREFASTMVTDVEFEETKAAE